MAGLSVDDSQKFKQGGTKLLAATTDRYDLVLSFCSEDGEFSESVSAESKGGKGDLAPVPWLDWLVNGALAAAAGGGGGGRVVVVGECAAAAAAAPSCTDRECAPRAPLPSGPLPCPGHY